MQQFGAVASLQIVALLTLYVGNGPSAVRATPTTCVYDAFADFSAVSNPAPDGRWSYGYSTTLGGNLTLYTTVGSPVDPRIVGWYSSSGNINKNISGQEFNYAPTSSTIPGSEWLTFHPGTNREYNIIRWTAPSPGTYVLTASFRSIRYAVAPTTTDVHVLLNSISEFDGLINGYISAGSKDFAESMVLHAGDRLDFVVGVGPDGSYAYDGTAVKATILTEFPCYTVSGRVTDPYGITGIPDVTISAGVSHSTTTDPIFGSYSIAGLAPGYYTLTASKPGYTFSPTSPKIRVTQDVAGLDFVGVNQMVPPSRFLDLPFDYSYTTFQRAASGNDGKTKGGGRINSWFDHTHPLYTGQPSSGTDLMTIFTSGYTRGDAQTSVQTCADYGRSGCYDGHDGIDFTSLDCDGSAVSLDVRAAASGTVVAPTVTTCSANCCSGGCAAGCAWGNYVVVYHNQGYFTRYAHLASVEVSPGSISAGAVVGTMGNTGASCGRHLHFSVYRDDGDLVWEEAHDKPVDPFGWRGLIDPWVVQSGGFISHYLWSQELGPGPLNLATGSGTVQDSTLGIKATIPPGWFTGPLTLDLFRGPVAAVQAPLRSAGRSFWLQPLEGLTSQLSTPAMRATSLNDSISSPITLTLTYSDTDVLHLDMSQVHLGWWDPVTGLWEALPTTMSGTNEITALSSSFGAFDLQAPLLCPSELQEPDDSFYAAELLSPDVPATRLFDIAVDEDWYRFLATGGKKYRLQTSGLALGVDTALQVYDLDGVTVLASDDNGGGGKASRLVWAAPEDGVYFVRISRAPGGAYSCNASYQISITQQADIWYFLPFIRK